MKFVIFIKKLFDEMRADRMFLVTSDLSFHMILAIFPFIIFLMSLFSLLNIDVGLIKSVFGHSLPEVIYDFIDELSAVRSSGVLSLSLFLAIYSASRGFKTAIDAMSMFYEGGRRRGMIKSTIISIALVFVVSLAIIAAGLIPVISVYIGHFFGYVLSSFVIAAMIMLFYRLGLPGRKGFSALLPGTAFTLAIWLAASKLFTLYITYVKDFSILYGSIGGIIALMYWINILSTTLLIGAEINAVLEG